MHCVLVGCNSERGSYRKTMSKEGGHNCLNNENNIHVEVWILNIEVWILNIEVWILNIDLWILNIDSLDKEYKKNIFRFHPRKWWTPESKPVLALEWCPVKRENNDFLTVYARNESIWSHYMKTNWELVPEQVTQAIDKSWLNENTFLRVSSVQCVTQGFWYFAQSRTREIQVSPRNPAKFPQKREIPRNPAKYFQILVSKHI